MDAPLPTLCLVADHVKHKEFMTELAETHPPISLHVAGLQLESQLCCPQVVRGKQQ